jgi:hypothetical protein
VPRCQEQSSLLIFAAADCGPERELVCYPTGHLGLRLIDHTSFRGTEFCAADQFSIFRCCIFLIKRKRFFNRFLKFAAGLILFHTLFIPAMFPEEGSPGFRPGDAFASLPRPRSEDRKQNLLANYPADRSYRYKEFVVYSTIRGDSAGYKPDEFREMITEMAWRDSKKFLAPE